MTRQTVSARIAAATLSMLVVSAPVQAATLPSYWCSFTEPFISIFSGADGVVLANSGAVEVVKQAVFRAGAEGGVLIGQMKNGGHFVLKIRTGAGSDGMSDQEYPMTGVLSGAFNINGGCVRLPRGSRVMQVVGVAPDDTLNLRAAPSASSLLLDRIRLQYLWLLSGKAKGGWVRVAAISFPAGEEGKIGVSQGWVNGKFLRPAGR